MYCPKCSQLQISEEMRFCSRCGFALGAVRELVASGNAGVETGAGAPPRSGLAVRKQFAEAPG